MKIAIPTENGQLNLHFGHCKTFEIIEVDIKENKIIKEETIDAPPHEPGLLPKWLAERNVNIIIAGGMGKRAQDLFSQNNIQVVLGAPVDSAQNLVHQFLENTLVSGENICDH